MLGIFKCEYQLSGGTKISHSLLQEREKIFKYKVLEQSAELDVKLTLLRDMSLPMVCNETSQGMLEINSSSEVKNNFLICSHPSFFGFTF